MIAPHDPRHGRRAGYIAGCRDTCCAEPHYRYQKRSKLRLLREGTQIVPATTTLERVTWWNARGVTANAIGEGAGIGYGTLAELIAGNRDHCLRSTQRAVLAVTWDHLDARALCYSSMTHRRIYSLMASGHTLAWIADQVGDGLPISGRWRNQQRVKVSLARAVARVAAAAPAAGTSTITAVKARNRGYLPIAAWDDPGTPAEPDGWQPRNSGRPDAIDANVIDRIMRGEWRLPATPAERYVVLDRWLADGGAQNELERRTHWNISRMLRDRRTDVAA